MKPSLVIALFLSAAALLFHFVFHPIPKGQWSVPPPSPVSAQKRAPVLLVPLDSRPPCTDFVVNGGKSSGETSSHRRQNIWTTIHGPEIRPHCGLGLQRK